MNEKFHIQLVDFNLQAISFVKLKELDESIKEIEPKYEVYIEKNEASTKTAFLHITIENEQFNLQSIFKGVFEDIDDNNIDNEKLNTIALSLMLPLARPVIYQNLVQSNLKGLLLPTLDIQRHINSND
ncbi:hypothetical protein WL766_10980 [Staphylococcus pasteuri]|uniref:hypothetical protein n=1 Tax=Staphylococcus pasteuri TaxID=45972 RepID=UPI001C26A225|nr:hypothetical protein [Staphylococcus pasteuri]MCO0862318.1 hypothetical protein [Staphylococcus pasteuri]MCO5361054.1 hypothetical protein [Staphylococcus pasteuri]